MGLNRLVVCSGKDSSVFYTYVASMQAFINGEIQRIP